MGLCASSASDPKNPPSAQGQRQEVKAKTQEFAGDKYEQVKTLGVGASCQVYAVRNKNNKKMFAMKVVSKSEGASALLYGNEIKILRMLQHPNILELIETYEDSKAFYIITVLCQGGELFDRVRLGSFSERDASKLTRDMLNALAYCHKNNVVHRDLKPENFVFETDSKDSSMKLIDFGCAKEVRDDELVTDYAGSPYYVAPEVLSEGYKRTGAVWKGADMWSIGVIVYLLVTGYPPFNGSSTPEIFGRIKTGRYRFPSKSKEHSLSESVKDLIRKLLVMDPLRRLSAADALKHPWVAGDAAPETPLPESVITALTDFQYQCRLKKAVGKVLVGRMTDDDRIRLGEVFKKFDLNGDGQLGPDEIGAFMKHVGRKEVDAKALIERFDENQDGSISVVCALVRRSILTVCVQDEFAVATQTGQLGAASEEQIKKNFDTFDYDHDGFVSPMEIERLCVGLSADQTRMMIKEVDKNQDGKINFNEWMAAMRGQVSRMHSHPHNHAPMKSASAGTDQKDQAPKQR